MCGIVGFCGPSLTFAERQGLLIDLLTRAEIRGSDATGIAFVQDGEMQILKQPKKATEFIKSEEFLELTKELPPIVLGHARASSRIGSGRGHNQTGTGNKLSDPEDNENNHPFYSEHAGIALVHNGFIDREFWEDAHKNDKSGIMYPFESATDSEAALRVLESLYLTDGKDLSFFDCVDNMTLNIAGSFAFGILKQDNPDTIWLVTKDKPLVLAWVPDFEALVFASTKDIISKAVENAEYEVHFNYLVQKKDITPDFVSHDLVKDSALEITIRDTDVIDELFNIDKRELTPTSQDYDFHKKIVKEKEEAAAEADTAEVLN